MVTPAAGVLPSGMNTWPATIRRSPGSASAAICVLRYRLAGGFGQIITRPFRRAFFQASGGRPSNGPSADDPGRVRLNAIKALFKSARRLVAGVVLMNWETDQRGEC